MRVDRRAFLASAAAVISGPTLAFAKTRRKAAAFTEVADVDPQYLDVYAAVPSEPFPVPAINLRRIAPAFLRATVTYDSTDTAIVVDPHGHYLYFPLGDGTAVRYGVGVGRDGFRWSGTAAIRSKQEWPDWYPPKEMIARQPELHAEVETLQSGIGVPGGPHNPLGARAMYLWQNNKDTLFRIHGTLEPWSVGHNVSSGCIRMINQDAMDLYERVPLGTQVVVL